MAPRADELVYARTQLERSHTVALSKEMLRDEIRESWQRSLDAGLDPTQTPKPVDISSQEVRELIDQESFLVHLARSEFYELQRQLPGDKCLIGFSNRNAVLIDVVCSNPTVRSASRAIPGSCWSETLRGTNAIGTAAFNRGPVYVSFQEHFLRHYSAVICAAAAVNDPDDELVGILQVSSEHPLRQRHTMSLLCMSALHIESALFRQRYRSEIVLQFHNRGEFTDTVHAGLIAFDEDGKMLSSNRQARLLLEGLLETGCHFDEIFRVPFRRFVARSQIAGALTQLVDIQGSSSSVRVHRPESYAKRWAVPRRAHEDREQARQSPGFVCSDPVVSKAVSLTARAVAMSIPILIRGETGTGKEMLAQYAHRLSGRNGRFIGVNCAAIPESLIESELFGYREGAFTGARSGGAEGLVLQADRGTLFLDEIGDMPLNLQPALLRFLDSWTVRPIGSAKEVKVNVQLITATNCDLEHAIAEKRFRQDLLYRIGGVEIFLPPLRDRCDFDEIVRDLLAQISPRLQIAEDALCLLREQLWSGNIRELRNILMRAAFTCTEPDLSTEAVEPFLRKRPQPEAGIRSHGSSLLDVRRKTIFAVYRRNSGNISKTAQMLCVSRNTVYRELRELGLIHGAAKGLASRSPH